MLQSTASSTISESGTRISIYLSCFRRTSLAGSCFPGRYTGIGGRGGSGHVWSQGLFNDLDLVRFEIEVWNAVDARLRGEFGA